DQGVLGDGVGGVIAQRPTQLGDLADRQSTVFRDHGGGRALELLRDLRDFLDLPGFNHTSPPLWMSVRICLVVPARAGTQLPISERGGDTNNAPNAGRSGAHKNSQT